MGNFDSPLGKKNFSSQSLREFDVPDGDDNVSQYKVPHVDAESLRHFQQSFNTEPKDPRIIEEEIRNAKEDLS